MTRIFFDNPKDAVKVAVNLGDVSLDESLSIEVDREEIQVALKQENIPPKAYSLAEVEDAK